MNTVLYYPKFEPDHRWLRAMLLFRDKICRVIPEEANHKDSRRTRELIDVMPGAFQNIAPTKSDTFFDNLNFERLENAFAKIKAKLGDRPEKRITFIFNERGTVTLQGDVWLSNAKLEGRVRELLFQYDLATDFQNPFSGHNPMGDMFPANEEASDLIISYVADRMAQRMGMDTVTDAVMPYAIQSLDALNISPKSLHRESEGVLASAIATLAVPEQIAAMDVYKFQELRETFSDIRGPFAELIDSLSAFAKLDQQQSAVAAEKRIQDAVAEYKRQMECYRNTAFARGIDKWAPIGIQTLLTILSIGATKEILELFAATGLGIEVLKHRIATKQEPQKNENVLRMLCRLEKKVESSEIIELV